MALNARQAAFVRHYTVGADGVRGNLGKAYAAAGYKCRGNAAVVAAGRLFTNVHVQQAIASAHARAEASAASKLRDWKQMAPAAQDRIEQLGCGSLPEGANAEAVSAAVMLAANREIVERGYPSKLELNLAHRLTGKLAVTVEYVDAAASAEAGE